MIKASRGKKYIIFKRVEGSLMTCFSTEMINVRKQLKNIHKILKCKS